MKVCLDYDNWKWRDVVIRHREVRSQLSLTVRDVTVKTRGRGFYHVVMETAVSSKVEAVAVQSILGSDHMREALVLTKALAGMDTWNKLSDDKSNFVYTGAPLKKVKRAEKATHYGLDLDKCKELEKIWKTKRD